MFFNGFCVIFLLPFGVIGYGFFASGLVSFFGERFFGLIYNWGAFRFNQGFGLTNLRVVVGQIVDGYALYGGDCGQRARFFSGLSWAFQRNYYHTIGEMTNFQVRWGENFIFLGHIGCVSRGGTITCGLLDKSTPSDSRGRTFARRPIEYRGGVVSP